MKQPLHPSENTWAGDLRTKFIPVKYNPNMTHFYVKHQSNNQSANRQNSSESTGLARNGLVYPPFVSPPPPILSRPPFFSEGYIMEVGTLLHLSITRGHSSTVHSFTKRGRGINKREEGRYEVSTEAGCSAVLCPERRGTLAALTTR